MDNPRPEKVAVVDEVRSRMESSSAVLLTEYRGLKVSELAELRRGLRAAGGDFKIYKNTLVRFAARDLQLEGVEELLVGPTAVAFVDGDVAAVAKTLRDFGRTNPNLVVKGGVLGTKALSAEDAKALADLPSREVLLARIAGGLAAPMVQFAGLLQALPRNLAYGLKALIDQKVAGGEAPAPAEDAAAPETPEPETDAAPPADDTPAEAPAASADEPVASDSSEAPTEDAAAPEAETPETDAAPAADEIPAEAPAASSEAPTEDAAAPEADTQTEAEAPTAEAETAEEA